MVGRKTLVLLLGLMLSGATARADGEVTLPCSWAKGDTFRYDTTSKREDSRPGLSYSISSRVEYIVEEVGEKSVVRLRVMDEKVVGPEVMEKIAEKGAEDMLLLLEHGRLVGVKNFEALKKEALWAVGLMQAGQPPEAQAQVAAMFEDEAFVTSSLLKAPGRFFPLHCASMKVGQETRGDIQQPNPIGGDPIQLSSKLTLAARDEQAGTVTFRTENGPKPGEIEKLLQEIITKYLPPDADDAMVQGMLSQIPPMESRLSGEYVMSVADGFPVRISLENTVGNEKHPLRRVDRWTWVRVEK